MPRRYYPMVWALPEVVHPPTTRCFVINVPDERNYIAAFRGALLALASGYNWADDDAHTAREVALVWWDICEQVDRCAAPDTSKTPGILLEDAVSTQIRISPDDSCIIQMWCIDHWEDWYDPRTCIATGSGQQTTGGEGQPAPGTSRTYCQTVLANTPYLYPVAVSTGDVIEVTDVSGAWSDANVGLLSQWFCPDGTPYTLGICAGSTTTDGADPMPTQPHMGLIAFVDPDYYFIGNGTSFVIPAGVTDAQLLLTCNTADFSNAMGSVAACVKITTPQPLPIDLTYSFGTGPASVLSGGIFTVTSSNNAGNQRFDVQSPSECVKWEVLSSSGWVSEGSTGSPFYADCASVGHNHSGADVAPEVFLANVDGVQIISNGAGTTPFTMQVRVTRLP